MRAVRVPLPDIGYSEAMMEFPSKTKVSDA